VRTPEGREAYGLLHRPANTERPGIWVSFATDPGRLAQFEQHQPVAFPEHSWEELKIGAGPPPLRTTEGWLLFHHGVSGRLLPGVDLQPSVRYCAVADSRIGAARLVERGVA
jgi:predicted GH43/DUF377 family glycosyl hydrolase